MSGGTKAFILVVSGRAALVAVVRVVSWKLGESWRSGTSGGWSKNVGNGLSV